MIVSLFARRGSRAKNRSFAPLAHFEYPIEQTVRCRDRRMKGFLLRRAWRQLAVADALCVAEESALRILGRSEAALKHTIARLVARHGNALVIEAPAIRYLPSLRGVLEPWMDVLVNVPERHGPLVERNFVRRRGHLRRLSPQGAASVLEGEAPLAELIGYDEWLRHLTDSDPKVGTWLSRYLPIDHGPQPA